MRAALLSCAGLLACSVPEDVTAVEQAIAAPAELATWIGETQIPLQTVLAGHGFTDLAPFAAEIGAARVVGIGEATHGTREFFQLKHRLIEYLVAERGFRVLAFEAGFPEALDVEDYIVHGRGDPARAVAGLGYWPWMTEEVLALVEWMRQWNRTHTDKVHFVGIDMQVPDRALREALGYLARVDPLAAKRFSVSLHMATSRYDYFTLEPEVMEALLAEAEAMLARFDARRTGYIAQSSAAAFVRQRQLAQVVVQAISMLIGDFTEDGMLGMNRRDASMADNVSWILEQYPGAKVAIWAHNDHVSKHTWVPDWISFGMHLADRLGDAYHAVGFAFDDGGFQALGATLRLQEFVVESGGPETLDGTLGELAAPLALLPLDDLPAGPVADYFAAPPLHRDIGAGYLDFIPEAYFREVFVADAYDTLAFVATTSRAEPLVYANDQISPQPTNPQPQSLSFESGTTGWFTPIANAVSGYSVTTTQLFPYDGTRSAVLARDTRRSYGKNYGELRQRFAAGAYAGKRVRLRAHVRSVLAPGARVHMWMRSGIAYDGMHDRPIGTHLGWETHDIVLDIPPTATSIQLGFVLVGDGIANIDAVTLQVL